MEEFPGPEVGDVKQGLKSEDANRLSLPATVCCPSWPANQTAVTALVPSTGAELVGQIVRPHSIYRGI